MELAWGPRSPGRRAPVRLAWVAAVLAAVFAPARALGAVTMTTEPSAVVSGWTLAPSGANSTGGGTMTIDATGPYSVTIVSDVNRMSEHDGTSYVASGRALGSALTVAASRTAGTAPVPGTGLAVATSTTAGTLATGAGLGTDTYSITLSQPTAGTDAALPGGRTYHIVLTYTAAPNV